MSEEVRRLLGRHEAFWRRELDRPLVSRAAYRPLAELNSIPLRGGRRAGEGERIRPTEVEPAEFYAGRTGPAPVVSGDFLRGEGPPHLCWTEAALGCPIRIATGGPWAEPFAESAEALLASRPDERWLERLDAFVDFLVARAGGAYPVVQPLLRGPIDMMASALGHETACLLLLEQPEAAEAVLSRCADLFIEVARRRLDGTPRFEGGFLSSFGIWAPGEVVRTQLDNATMLSPRTYRERVRRHDRRVIEAFEFPLIHVHSGCLHIVDELLEIEALRCIQVSIDYPGGPLASEVLPVLERILPRKALIVSGPVSEEESETLGRLTPGGGLCLQLQVVSQAQWLRDGLPAAA
jgi:hypothetical protein